MQVPLLVGKSLRFLLAGAFFLLLFSTRFSYSASAQSAADTVYVDVPDMPASDLQAVLGWIKSKVEMIRTPYCYRDSYGRGAGVVRSVCAEGQEKGNADALCYPKCGPGFKGVGPVCWAVCPSGYSDGGAFCSKPASTTRSGRVADKGPCDPGQRDDGTSCWEDLKTKTEDKGYYNYTWGCGTAIAKCWDGSTGCKNNCYRTWIVKLVTTSTGCGCIKKTLFQRQSCRSNEDLYGGYCYPKCPAGSHAVECCICSPDCPNDNFTDAGATCTKKSYTRGAGQVLQCPTGYTPDETGGPAGLCYPACKSGYHGVGPVCWMNCPDGLVPCGAGCAASKTDCATTTFDQVFSVAVLAANIATMGGASKGASVAKAGEEIVSVGSKFRVVKSGSLAKYMWRAVDFLQTASGSANIQKLTVVRKYFNPRTFEYLQKAAVVAKYGESIAQAGKDVYDAVKLYSSMYSGKFEEQTSAEINTEINNRFSVKVADYIKSSWAEIQLNEMAAADGFAIAKNVMDLVSIVDVTGVVAVINAYAHPVCKAAVPFPTLSQAYK